MRKYLSTLHTRPDHHKRRFALLTSSIITLFIFSIWSFVNFGEMREEIIAENVKGSEISPFDSLRMSLASSFEAMRESFLELKSGLETRDLETGYKELKDEALNTYDQ